ncbi:MULTISPECIES: BPL-N domain-containing protein [unclassified Nocardia]|uniref:BPL-N domain-containing protein n=1 Tax=unclassified Nocardia TaxID=2637762 RepID=UPI001CE3E839|nr:MULTISPECIES: BPL-N domain-containing protein [unclassified Nocardia]
MTTSDDCEQSMNLFRHFRSDAESARPIALVYRGPATLPGCPEAAAAVLAASRWNFDIRFIGPREHLRFGDSAMTGAAIYVQPGGGELEPAYRHLKSHRGEIRHFVRDGGGYLGFCLGGYLAGATPGFDLLPGDTDRYIDTRGATVDHDDDTVISVRWRGQRRQLYFQDGPIFDIETDGGTQVLATYTNGTIAAAVTEFGRGRVGVCGPHPEATSDWFTDAGLRDPGRGAADPHIAYGHDLAIDLVDTVLTR